MKKNIELNIIISIAERALTVGFTRDQFLSLTMDVKRFHNLQPLRLNELLEADHSTFSHDIGGIWRHYDRKADAVTGCFLARMAA